MTAKTVGLTGLLAVGVLFSMGGKSTATSLPPVIINELMWMGSSFSSNDEWIELWNTTDTPVDLTNWKLTKLSNGAESTMLVLPSGTIPAKGYFIIANDPAATSRLSADPNLADASMALVNSKLQIGLYDAGGILVDRADDGSGNPLAGEYVAGKAWKSMERNRTGGDGTVKESWHTTSQSVGFDDQEKELGTPGSANSNSEPIVVLNAPETSVAGEAVNMDASQSTDSENDPLTFHWEFGDGSMGDGQTPTHIYQSAGTYAVRLTVADGEKESSVEKVITIQRVPSTATVTTNKNVDTANANAAPPTQNQTPTTPVAGQVVAKPDYQTSTAIVLNEILPNPDGPDGDNEFIELKNIGTTSADLNGWSLLIGKKKYIIQSSIVLDGGDIAIFSRPQTKLTLANGGGSIYLLDPFKKIIQGIKYGKAETALAFARNASGQWRWTEVQTPGEENVISETPSEPSDSKTTTSPTVITLPLAQISSAKQRQKVIVEGTVATPVGIIGTRDFSIVDGTAAVVVTIESGDDPELEPGQRITLHGKVGTSRGQPHLTVAGESDIAILGNVQINPLPFTSGLPSGALTTIEGVVSEKKRVTFTLTSESGDTTVHIVKPSGIVFKDIQAESALTITGIWRNGEAGFELYPRSPEDIVPKGVVQAAEISAGEQPSQTSAVTVPDQPKKKFPVETAVAVAACAVIGGFVVVRRRFDKRSQRV